MAIDKRKYFRYKLVITKNSTMLTTYSRDQKRKRPRTIGKNPDISVEELKKKKKKWSESNFNRTRSNLRNLIDMNFQKNHAFITLTFKEVISRNEAVERYRQFIRWLRIRYKHVDLKYLTVIEYQKRGSPHFHTLINRNPKWVLILTAWKKYSKGGSIHINKIKHVNNIGAYISKYLTKDTVRKYDNKYSKYYWYSRNLEKPRVVRLYSPPLLMRKEPYFTRSVFNDKIGKINYHYYKND